jgi:uncharacterized protein (TIGR03545 family)/uncharacterized protein (TIGR03546 family)
MTTTESRDYSADQMAVGFVLGAALGLTPLLSPHNVMFLAAPIMLRLSLSTFTIAWIGAIPFGFLLDPLFHRLGSALLSSEFLTPLWIQAANAPLVPLTQFNNTVTLGSLVVWSVAAFPLFFLSRRGVDTHRGGLERLESGIPVVGAIGRSGIMRRLLGLEAGRRGWIRKGFVLPLAFFVGLGVGAWWLFADRGMQAAVERAGTRIMGATVDVGTMDVDLSDGILVMTGLQVTNPSTPENNIVEIGEIGAALSTGPLLRAKVAIDSVVVRDIRFNTRRETPGEVDTLRERNTLVRDEMARWRASTRIPTIPTPNLSGLVDFSRLSADSLETVIRARELAASVDAARGAFTDRVEALDVGAQIDSASALLASLEGASIRSLGPVGTARTLGTLRSMAAGVTDIVTHVAELEESLGTEVAGLRRGLAALDDLRDGDYRKALGVLNLPSFDPDDISAALLQAPLMERVETLLYWARAVDANLPDGSRSFRLEGSDRLRAAGEDVMFPSVGSSLPSFALNKLEGSVTIGPLTGVAIRILDLSSDPRATGRPTTVQLTGGSGAARAVLDLSLDRTRDVAVDRLEARFSGLPLPSLEIAPLDARLDLGDGGTRVDLSRSGDSIVGAVTWSATDANWQRTGPDATGAAGYLWDLVSSLTSIEITLGLDGTLSSPGITVRSNIGGRIVQALRDQIGDEVRRAEAQARAQVDRLIEQALTQARSQVAGFEEMLGGMLSDDRGELARLETSLETRLRELTPRLPNLPRLPG